MEIHIETIPHKDQRYDTCGDYWMDENGVLQIRVSDMKSEISEQMVAVHELIEVIMCNWKGIRISDIDEFDMKFEEKRANGNLDEPGFDPKSPYKNEHAIATAVELLICAHLNISWKEYEEKINKL